MEYKLVFRAYNHSQLFGGQRIRGDLEESGKSENQSVLEAKDWSATLNASAREGFNVKNSGVLSIVDNLVFWALLEKQ
jgi:hypothetical protein